MAPVQISAPAPSASARARAHSCSAGACGFAGAVKRFAAAGALAQELVQAQAHVLVEAVIELGQAVHHHDHGGQGFLPGGSGRAVVLGEGVRHHRFKELAAALVLAHDELQQAHGLVRVVLEHHIAHVRQAAQALQRVAGK